MGDYTEFVRQHHHMALVLEHVAEERRRQVGEWTREHDDEHSRAEFLTLIAVFLGKASADRFNFEKTPRTASAAEFRAKLVKLAAVAVAAIEAHDRRLSVLTNSGVQT